MKNNSSLDDHIKKQFSNYKPDVPAHIWQNIVAGKERKRPVLWFSFYNKTALLLLLGASIIATGIILYKVNYNNLQHKTGNNSPEKIKHDPSDIASQNGNKNKYTEPLTTETVSAPTVIDPLTINNNSIFVEPLEKKSSRNKQYPAANSDIIGGADRQTNNPKGRKFFKWKTGVAISAPDIVNESEGQGEIANADYNDLLKNASYMNFDLLHSSRGDLSLHTINIPELNIPCPRLKRGSGNGYVEVYGGPDHSFRSITDTGNSVYMKKREESSTFSSAFSAGIRYTKVFNNGMSFRTGLNYSQINEKFKYQEGNIIQVVYITNANGDTTGSFSTSATRYKTTYNKFKTIDIPLLIGYEVENGRFTFNFNAGAIVNIYSWQRGDVLDTAYKPISITTGKGSSPYQFKTNSGIGFLAAASIYYKLTDRMHLLAEPYFRYNFSPASKSDLTLKQKYNTAGIRLGLRFDL
ncbi:MAG: hypothetical protein ABIO04_04670 [Ferruginibacter sp.]